ncbi:MAG: hypothetical protein ACOC1K_03585 [Nanoarchaeota archaeon]
MPLINDTVKLKAKFYDYSGNPLNLNNISITVYDKEKETIDEIEEDNIDKPNDGEYEYEYTIPEGHGYISVEFKGEFSDEKTTVVRQRIEREWDRVGD